LSIAFPTAGTNAMKTLRGMIKLRSQSVVL
jgi:hypothetical protein